VVKRSKALVACVYLVVILLCSLLAQGESRTLIGTITCNVPAGLEVILDQSPIVLTIDPDNSPSDQITLLVGVGTNAPPVAFDIGLSHHSPVFSYRLTPQGIPPVSWKEIPVWPTVSPETLPELGWNNYSLDLRGTAGFDLSAGVYQDDIHLRFQIPGIIRTFVLPVTTTVLPRSPVVDAGPDKFSDEGNTVAFSGSFFDPDIGETYTISWDFGDGTTASGTLTPTHVYDEDGTYTVILSVTDSGGRSGQDALTVAVSDLGPTAHVETVPPVLPPLPVTVNAGEELRFDASGSTSSPDAIVAYEWDWNYGGLAFNPSGDTGDVVTHVFDAAGTYTIAVRVTDDDGSTDIAALEVTVNSVTTAEATLAPPEIVGGGGAVAEAELAIDELYVHHEALAVSQFHLALPQGPEQPSTPVIHFPFDEGDGEVAYNEIDKQSAREPVLEGMLSQAEWIEGKPLSGSAFALSLGDEGYVTILPDPRMGFTWNQDFTLELWVRTTDASGERPVVRRQRSDGGSLYGLTLVAGMPLFYTVGNAEDYTLIKGERSLADGAWHHIACVRDGGELKLYLDGNLGNELLPEPQIAGVGGGDLSSQQPTYVGRAGAPIGGFVDAVYYIGEPIEFHLRLIDETETPVTDARPSLSFIQYDAVGRKVESGFIDRLSYNADEVQYVYSLDTSNYAEGVYDFFLVPGDGSQERLRLLLLEVE